MKVSILIPTHRRPHQLVEALASLAEQPRELIGEIVVGDDSPANFRRVNRAAIAASPVADLVRYTANDPPLGNYPNQWSLAEKARYDHVLILHDDDQLCPGGLELLVAQRLAETDERVKVWFGRDQIMDAQGQIDVGRSRDNAKAFGKEGPACAKPVWQWCLRQSLPPDASLLERQSYLALMRGERDGNAGDWGLHVRLANAGAWGRFIDADVSRYRVQNESITGSQAGIDVQYMYEMAHQLRVPADHLEGKRRVVRAFAEVATRRYLRAGERGLAWRCYASRDWPWRRRLSPRGIATLALLLAPPRVLRSVSAMVG